MNAGLEALFAELGPWPVVLAAAIYFLGGFAKGAVGFALPMITVSLLPLVLPVQMAVAINAAILPLMNVYQSAQGGLILEPIRRFWPMFVGIAIGVPIGAALISVIDGIWLLLAIGVFLALFSTFLLVGPTVRIPPSAVRPAAGVAGVLAGVIGALITTTGPIFITFLVGVGAERRLMVSSLAVFFLFSGLLVFGSFMIVGILTGERLLLAALCAPPAFLGQWLGNRMADRLSAPRFRRIVLVVLLALGLNMVVRAFLGM